MDRNPFASIVEEDGDQALASQDSQETEKKEKRAANPFAQIIEDDQKAEDPTSALGAGAAHAGMSLIPSAGSLAGAGAGAELGAAAGAPAGPIGAAVGGIGGALVGGFGGAAAVAKLQEKAIEALPQSWKDPLVKYLAKSEQEHPTASFIGGLAPFALTMSPGGAGGKGATAVQRLMETPVTARLFGGAVMGGLEVAQEKMQGEPVNWTDAAIATGFGMIWNRPNTLGKRITGWGARPVAKGLEAFRKDEPVAGRGGEMSADLFKREPMTVNEARDLGVLDAGATEETFMGNWRRQARLEQEATEARRAELPPKEDIAAEARKRDPEAFDRFDALSQERDTIRQRIRELQTPPDAAYEPHKERVADLEKELAALPEGGAERTRQTDKQRRRLTAELGAAKREIAALDERRARYASGEAVDTEEIAAHRKHLADLDYEMRDLGRTMASAYRHAEDRLGRKGWKPEATENVTTSPDDVRAAPEASSEASNATGTPPAATPIADHTRQRQAIVDHSKAKWLAAGVGEEEADAIAQVEAAHYMSRASWMNGKLGTAEELYGKRGVEVEREGQEPPRAPRAPPAPVAPSPVGDAIRFAKDLHESLKARAEEKAEEPPLAAEPAPLIPTPEKPVIAPEPVSAAPDESLANGLEAINANDIHVDAKRMQFKAGGDEEGVTERLKGVDEWNPMLAGTVIVWRDAAGKNWVADGHQRTGLARRLMDNGHDPIKVNAFVLKESEGFTDADARVQDAAKNIAEGTGTAIDAAKIFKEAEGLNIKLPPLPPRSTLVKDGRALANLSPDAFGLVINEVVPPNMGAIVGRLVKDPLQQVEALRIISKAKIENVRQAEIVVKDMLHQGTEMATATGSLFGEEAFASSVVLERAKILDDAIKLLKSDKKTFKTLVEDSDRIAGHGANKLDVEANKSRLTEDERVQEYVEKLATRAGPISDALTDVAKRFKAGDTSRAEAARTFLGAVRGKSAEVVAAGDRAGVAEPRAAGGGEASAYEAGAEGLPQGVIPGTEKIGDREYAERLAQKPMRGGRSDMPAGGLFDEDAQNQNELFQAPTREEQRAQTDSPEFKRYFEGSVVTNEDGSPKIMYHGATPWEANGKQLGDIHAFDRMASVNIVGRPQWLDTIGSWFSDHPGDTGAGMYAGRSGAIYPVFLSIKKPLKTSFDWLLDKAKELGPVEVDKWKTPKGSKNKVMKASPEAYERLHNWLIEQGYDGVHIEKGKTGEKEFEDQDVFIALHPEQIKSATGNRGTFDPNDPRITFQDNYGGPKGKISLKRGTRSLITLFKDADPSTAVHEMGHDFLRQMGEDAFHPEAPGQLKDDFQTVLDWLKVDDPEDLFRPYSKKKDPYDTPHERFARGFEQYMMEGRAPSKGLARVFEKFKNWMVRIYEGLAGTGVKINPEIRAVFDRMLTENPDRVVIAEREPAAPALGDVHTADAHTTEPEHAVRAANAIEGEIARRLEELPNDTRNRVGTPTAPEPDAASGSGGSGSGAAASDRAKPVQTGGGDSARSGEKSQGAREAAPDAGGLGGEQPAGVAGLAPDGPDTFPKPPKEHVEKNGNIRLETISTEEDIHEVLKEIGDANDHFMEVRGPQTDKELLDFAYSSGLSVEEIDSKAAGFAKYLGRAGILLRQASTATRDMAVKWKQSGSDEDLLEFTKALERTKLAQRTFARYTAESGRALRAHQVLIKDAKIDDIPNFLEQEGPMTLFQLKMFASAISELETPAQAAKMIRDSQNRSFGRMLFEYWVNGLISGPITHFTYVVGNSISLIEKVGPETAIAAALGAMKRANGKDVPTVRFGEIPAQLKTIPKSIAPALKATLDSLQHGSVVALPGEDVARVPYGRGTAFKLKEDASMADVGASLHGLVSGVLDGFKTIGPMLEGKPGARMVDLVYSDRGLNPNVAIRGVEGVPLTNVGDLSRLPSRFISAFHTFSRVLAYSCEKNALAYRQAAAEGHTGTHFDARVADLMVNPTHEIMETAHQEANLGTLMSYGGSFTKSLAAIVDRIEPMGIPIGKFIMPFVHISTNILEEALVKRTPLGFLSQEIRNDLAGKNGSMAQDKAAARMIAGTSLIVGVGAMVAQGKMTGSGPGDPKAKAVWQAAGWQPYSVRIGDSWYSYKRLGPLAVQLGVAADLYHVSQVAKEEDMTAAAGALVHAIAQNVLDESWIRGPADLLKAMQDEHGHFGAYWARNLVSSFTPYSVGMSQMARQADPYTRDARSLTDTLMQKIPAPLPYNSTNLPTRLDIWGNPLPGREGLGPTAVWMTHVSADPVNQELMRLQYFPSAVDKHIRGVELDEAQHREYAALAGHITKSNFDRIVNSGMWKRLPDYQKTDALETALKTSRETARGYMMARHREIIDKARELKLAPLSLAGH